MSALAIDLSYVPYSRFGSYLCLNHLNGQYDHFAQLPHGLWLRHMHGGGEKDVFRLEPLVDGEPAAFELAAYPGELQLQHEAGVVRLCLVGSEQVRIRCEGLGLRLHMREVGAFDCAVQVGEGQWLLNVASAVQTYTAVRLQGELQVDAPWAVARCHYVTATILPGSDGVAETALHQAPAPRSLPSTYRPFAEEAAAVAADFEAFCETLPAVAPQYREAARTAAYINWSATVGACGLFRRPAMLMSKNWMCRVWSWDHCFNAMALAQGWPELAWDQFMLMFDHQTDQGQLPDMLDDTVVHYNFVKPPIHGWAYRAMLAANDVFAEPERLTQAYNRLAAWSRWWLNWRNPEGDGLPRYYHGNDSGWDNGTVFDVGLPVRGADLGAFLALQLEVLGEMADRLGRRTDAAEWRALATRTREALLAQLWTGDRFVTRHALTGEVNEQARSIIPCAAIVLGKQLPAEVRQALVARIRENLTEWGPATESPDSALYEDDGYWRGPIWAPSTMLLVEGLRAAGEDELAADIAARFCRLCVRGGFAENYDARSGAPLRDRAYTWTASAFLLLAQSG